ncbi:MAG TPA: hypothetical protein VN918_05960 [Myxococcaceae bacterium]|nr:hypothetical protein [Myxococcaceae bacterium]
MNVVAIGLDVLREARHRYWLVALAAAITLILIVLGVTLQLDVVDGALASTRLFGAVVGTGGTSADIFFHSVFKATTYVIFYGGLLFGIVACSDFAPSLLSPGRIESLLALPVRRWELLAGTFAGVLTLSVAGALYGAGGLTLVLGLKTGIWSIRPIAASLLASVAFAAVYGTMLVTSLFVRSAPISAAVGGMLLVAGMVAGYRTTIATAFQQGFGRSAFLGFTFILPRISALADASANFASSAADQTPVLPLLAGFLFFVAGMLAIGAWKFEQRDF